MLNEIIEIVKKQEKYIAVPVTTLAFVKKVQVLTSLQNMTKKFRTFYIPSLKKLFPKHSFLVRRVTATRNLQTVTVSLLTLSTAQRIL